MVLGILVALWTSSVSVAEEIEGRTALTVLSKPVSRRQFILGKFFGVIGPVFLLFVLLGLVFLLTVSYKVVYDARETANPDPTWRDCFLEMSGIIPGLVLAFLETVTLASVSVAISTRLPMLANLMICFSIYVLGHLVPQLVMSSVGKFPIVTFMGQLLATVLPVLEHFNIQAAVAAGATVPASYLLWALGYCVLYSTVAMLFALALFEDRDVA
jgi:ABC-type transport system involved in multi-copper enzyme maturation permease subunit